ncbi:MAG: penicillin-binding protein 2 [Chloroflexota bacterium]
MQRLMPFQGWRLTFFQGIVFAVFAIFGLRMYQFQVLEAEELKALADENRLSRLPIAAPRGVIFDRNNQPLAINVPAFNVTIVPADLPSNEAELLAVYNRLSALTGVPPTIAAARQSGSTQRSIEELVAEGAGIAPYRAVIVAQDVDRRVAMQIREESLSLPGVAIEDASVREYPTGQLTSHIIGYMGRIPAEQELELLELGYNPAYDRIGYAGVEAYLESILAGQRGSVLREVDVAGRPIAQVEYVAPQPGRNVRLTIDTELQAAAERALRDRIARINADAGRIRSQTGVVIAMNPKTGEVQAMVSWPSYDNSRFARAIDVEYYLDVTADPLRPLYNQAISSLYPPGSIWKMITAVGVLQENVIAPETRLFDGGTLVLPNRYAPNDAAASQTFVCWLAQGHEYINMIGAIAQSCDVYFYQVGGGNPEVSPAILREGGLGINNLFRYATAFGIGSRLGIELPGENGGRMPDRDWKRRVYGESWSTGDTYNAAFGQGYVTTTPLQLINAIAAIANGGTLYRPTIVHEYLDAQGNTIEPFEPDVLRTLNLELLGEDEMITLLPLEDMIMKGPSSLACLCEQSSPYYNEVRCNPESYTNTVDIDPDPFLEDLRQYRVSLPPIAPFSTPICNELRFNPEYTPPFVSTRNIQLAQMGMRETIISGTGMNANLPYVTVAGKTGTAEYCDDIARPLGLCVPGNWPAHAWFVAYAPYEDPEIIIIAFVYNGGEGSANALPIVRETMEAYMRLKVERGGTLPGTAPTQQPVATQSVQPPDADNAGEPDTQ